MRTPSIVALLVFTVPLALTPAAVNADPLILKTHPAPIDRVAPPLPDRDLYPQRPSLPQTPRFIEAALASHRDRSGRCGRIHRAEPAGGLTRGGRP